jgi:hypothetical protein
MMFNPRDPGMPGEYDRIRTRASEMQDAVQRVSMDDRRDLESGAAGLSWTARRTALLAAAVIALGVVGLIAALVAR